MDKHIPCCVEGCEKAAQRYFPTFSKDVPPFPHCEYHSDEAREMLGKQIKINNYLYVDRKRKN